MKLIDYVLFRIYFFYKEVIKEKDDFIFSVSVVFTTIIGINILTILAVLKIYFDLKTKLDKGSLFLIYLTLLFLVYLYVRKKTFLVKDFKKDLFGGLCIIFYIFMSLIMLFIFAKISHDKILR